MGSDDNFHGQIVQAYNAGKIDIGVDVIRANSPGSPTYNAMDSFIPGILIVIFVIFCFWINFFIGIASAIIGVFIFITLVRKFVMSRVRERTKEYALAQFFPNWDNAWDRGLLQIVFVESPSIICSSPDGDWKQFVRQYILSSQNNKN